MSEPSAEKPRICDTCARGYHIEHVTDWRLSVFDNDTPVNGSGECVPLDGSACACEWRA